MAKIVDFKNFLKINESVSSSDLVGNIDYTLLDPGAGEDAILELCEKATLLGVKSVCVLPKMVSVAASALADSPVLVCTVVSFPHGTDTPEQKLAETKKVIADGADEVDMVLNYPKLKEYVKIAWVDKPDEDPYESSDDSHVTAGSNIYDDIFDDVETLVNECHKHTNKDGEQVILKVIVESGLLSEEETELATQICIDADADFIKTSTGMVSVGAELNKVQVMRDVIEDWNSNMKIKASGAIRTLADLQKFAPYVDRFGVGFGSVDAIFGGAESSDSAY